MGNLTTAYLEELCNKYGITKFESPRDNFLMLIQSNKPTKEELWLALEIYDEWLIALYED